MSPLFLNLLFNLILYVSSAKSKSKETAAKMGIHFPAEGDRHERTFMAWPGTDIWDPRTLNLVQSNIAGIAEAIVEFEPVTLIVSSKDYATASRIVNPKVEILKLSVDDLWARDTVPVFTIQAEDNAEDGTKKRNVVGVDFNFNGWGNKQYHKSDAVLGSRLLETFKIRRSRSSLVAEGGSFETDGNGTLLVTESSVINDNRNRGKTKDEISDELKRVFGVKKIIWFKGVKGQDITDAHVDCVVRFSKPGRVILTRPGPGADPNDIWSRASADALKVLQSETDARGEKFEIVDLFEPDFDKIEIVGNPKTFVSSYVNFYIANGAVILPKFGDGDADVAAQAVLQKEFPDRKIVPVKITGLASGGGGIHCATHDLPALP